MVHPATDATLLTKIERQPDIVFSDRARAGFGIDQVVEFSFLELLADFTVLRKAMQG